jgi:hypothetical protein
MGLFSSKKKIYVSSVAYNMAGDLADRPDYLRSTVARYTFNNLRRPSIGTSVINSQLRGPTMDQRAFYRWARTNYPLGQLNGNISNRADVDPLIVAAQIPLIGTETITVSSAFIEDDDIAYWAERHIADTRPNDFATNWIAEWNPATSLMEITYADLTQEFVPVPDYVDRQDYLYAYFDRNNGGVITSHVFIYQIGTGNAALDALVTNAVAPPEFFPVIPIRLNNVSITAPAFAADYPLYEKAYKKTGSGEFEQLIDDIEANASIGDIDYAFMVHGVELNTQENCGKKYLFEFFRTLIPYQTTTIADIITYENFTVVYNAAVANLNAWAAAQSVPGDPLFGTPKPVLPVRITPRESQLSLSTSAALNYKLNLRWMTLEENVSPGLGQPGAQVGDLWFVKGAVTSVSGAGLTLSATTQFSNNGSYDAATLYWQDTPTSYRTMTIYGMVHRTIVYQGKAEEISLHEALDDPDETSFIVPLHYPTLCKMPIVDANQLAASNRLVVFNSYKVVKIRWYQRGIFKIVLAIVLIVIFPPAGGIVGSSLAVGTTLGFTGVAALVAGAIANYLAAMILMSAVSMFATKIFGAEIGAIITAIVGFVVMSGDMLSFDGGSIAINWGEFMKADNLLGLTNSVSSAVTQIAAAKIGKIESQMETEYDEYTKQMKEIEKRSAELLGYSGVTLDPLMLVSKQGNSSYSKFESRSDFLARTKLLGSDLAEISFAMIYDFPELTLDLSNTLLTG